MTTTLPTVITEYFRASALHDTDAIVATFTSGATVVDDGATHTGHQQIRTWRDETSSAFEYTTTIVDVASEATDDHTVTADIAGNFPGSPVQLRYRFTLDRDLIGALTIGT